MISQPAYRFGAALLALATLAPSTASAQRQDQRRSTPHEVHISAGGHTWINWRHYLSAFAPKLFHGDVAAHPGF